MNYFCIQKVRVKYFRNNTISDNIWIYLNPIPRGRGLLTYYSTVQYCSTIGWLTEKSWPDCCDVCLMILIRKILSGCGFFALGAKIGWVSDRQTVGQSFWFFGILSSRSVQSNRRNDLKWVGDSSMTCALKTWSYLGDPEKKQKYPCFKKVLDRQFKHVSVMNVLMATPNNQIEESSSTYRYNQKIFRS
jgi:hypothetical protein